MNQDDHRESGFRSDPRESQGPLSAQRAINVGQRLTQFSTSLCETEMNPRKANPASNTPVGSGTNRSQYHVVPISAQIANAEWPSRVFDITRRHSSVNPVNIPLPPMALELSGCR